ncbi:MAG: hypothetical protein ACLQAH_10815 [Limisphaerales bacterium]
MKTSKLASAIIAATLALWTSNAQAQVLQPFPKLNFDLVAAQQELDVYETSSNVFVSTIKTFRITNKDLLKFLATALNTNWPAGAQLARDGIGIIVVDKTGTNNVFDVSTGMNAGDTNVVFFSMDSDCTVVRSELEVKGRLIAFTNEFGPGVGISGNSGSISAQGSDFGEISFHLFFEQDGVTNTDLYFDGLNATEFHSIRVLTANKSIVYDITSEQAPVTGDGTFDNTWTVIKGKVTGSSKWNSPVPNPAQLNPVQLNPVQPFTNIFTPPTNWPSPILLTNIISRSTNLPPLQPNTNTIIIYPYTNIFVFTSGITFTNTITIN